MMFTGWSTPLGLLEEELGQRAYEGHPVPESLRDKVAAIEDADAELLVRRAADRYYPGKSRFH